MRLVFFLANFVVAVLFWIGSVICFFVPETPGQLGAGVLFPIPSATFALFEWLAFMRNCRRLERVLGIACFILSGLVLFGVIVYVIGAAGESDLARSYFFIDVPLGLGIAAYLAACGYYRYRSTPRTAPPPASTAPC